MDSKKINKMIERIAHAIYNEVYRCGLSDSELLVAISKAFTAVIINSALVGGADRRDVMKLVTDEMNRLNDSITDDMIGDSIETVKKSRKDNPALWN